MSLDPEREPVAPDTATRPAANLSMTVVEYDAAPDRCTVSPPGLSDAATMTTWMSVNRSVVVDLTRMR